MVDDSLINRKPAVSGSFYPASYDALMKQIEKHFNDAAPGRDLENIVAVIVPHAGYVYSGTVAASAFKQLPPGKKYDNIFIIGSSHHASFDGAALYVEGNFMTPLGIAKVNIPLSRQLIRDNPGLFISSPGAHAPEHSLEVEIPFLQYLYKDDIQIVPIILGTQKPSTCKKIAGVLKPYLNDQNLFVISTDFSHYPSYEDAVSVDASTANAILANSASNFINAIENNESKGIHNLVTSICGWTSMLTLLDITEKIPGAEYHKISYMNSGDASIGDKDRVVGYNALVLTMKSMNTRQNINENYSLTENEKEQLLQTARNTIKNYLENGTATSITAQGYSEKLLTHSGAFVTLTENGALRGCIGQFTSDRPLYEVIQDMAIAAATKDYRFKPLTKEELGKTEIEISVLTPLHRIQSINEIVLGKHGIYIKKGYHSGTFLPQVARDTGWSLEDFLGHCARDKAGIGWDGWKDAELYTYEAYVFKEK